MKPGNVALLDLGKALLTQHGENALLSLRLVSVILHLSVLIDAQHSAVIAQAAVSLSRLRVLQVGIRQLLKCRLTLPLVTLRYRIMAFCNINLQLHCLFAR